MKQNHIAKSLLAGTGVSENDAARLTLEAIETLGELATGANRPELVTLLRRVIQAGVAAVKAAEHTVSLSVAAWASVEARKDLRPTTRRDLRHFVRRILRVEGAADMPLRSMSTADCKRILAAAFGASPSSYRKGRVILSSVFSYGIRQEWADSNPVTRIEVPAVQEKPIEPLTPEEVEKLQATASRPEFRDMRFSLSLMLYGGIRPTEVSRLQAGDINWEEGHVIIRPRASKTGGGRAVPLRGVRGIRKRDRHIPATGSADGRLCEGLPGSATGCRMSAATPSPRTTPPSSGICRSCSWRWATAIPRCCVPATWYPPGARMPRASGKVPDCPGAQKHTCKGRMEPRPDKRTA